VKKIVLSTLLFGSLAFAEMKTITVNPYFIENTTMKIIDIRTPAEWLQTGVVEDSYKLTFYDAKGGSDPKAFMSALNKIVKKNEQFAIICRTGSRTKVVGELLGANGYRVINLNGGIIKVMADKIPLTK